MNTQILLVFLLTPITILAVLYSIFPRQYSNLMNRLILSRRKRYVICHVRYASGLQDVYHIVPNPQGLTKVGEYSYDLNEKYSVFSHNKRQHYVVDENDTIPRNFEIQTKERIIFQASEIQTALNNTVMDYLFSRKKELLIIGLFILSIVSMLAILYNIYELRTIMNYIEAAKTASEVVVK